MSETPEKPETAVGPDERVEAAAAALAQLLIQRSPVDRDRIAIVAHRAPDGLSTSYSMSVDLRGHWFDDVAPLLVAIQGLAGRPVTTTFAELVAHRDGAWELTAAWEDGLEHDHEGLTRTLDPAARPETPANFPFGWAPTPTGSVGPANAAPATSTSAPAAAASVSTSAPPPGGLGERLRRWFGRRPSTASPANGPMPSPSPGPSPLAPVPTGEVDLDALRRHVRARLSAYQTVNPPATREQLRALETVIGSPLPDELLALYAIADGAELDLDRDEDEAGGIHGWYGWLSIEEITKTYAWTRRETWLGWSLGWDEARLETNPYGTVKRVGGDPGWIPILDDGGGNWIGLDLAPAADGRVGQVIEFGRDFDTAAYLAPSLTALFQGWQPARPRASMLVRAEDLAAYAPGQPLDDALDRLITAEPALQELRLFGLPRIDLAPLSRLAGLRVLAIDAPGVDLSSLQQVPLESILMIGDGVDLRPLTGHPSLARVRLRSVAAAELAVLDALPGLVGLDVGDSPALVLGGLGASLERLTFARLHHRQWRALLDAGRPLPRLAACTVAGAPTFAEALALAEGLDRPGRRLAARRLTRSSRAR